MKLQRTQRKIERSMLGINIRDRVRNEEIRKRSGMEDVMNVRSESGNGFCKNE